MCHLLSPLYILFNTGLFPPSAIIQNILLFLLGLPAHNAVLHSSSHSSLVPNALTPTDYILASLSLVTLVLEFTADNQQYSYQTFKHAGVSAPESQWPGAMIRWTKEDAQRGFVTRGLWSWTRHPNFACEQTFWVRSPFDADCLYALLLITLIDPPKSLSCPGFSALSGVGPRHTAESADPLHSVHRALYALQLQH